MIVIHSGHLAHKHRNDTHFNINAAQSITYDNVVYKYYDTGLCRDVYKSDETGFVIKVPKVRMWLGFEEPEEYPGNGAHNVAIDHNIAEALMYEECPDNLKWTLPKTTLIENGWVKQELCSNITKKNMAVLSATGLLEYGYKKSTSIGFLDNHQPTTFYQATFFDFCFMMKDFQKPKNGWDWELLEDKLNALYNTHDK
jgi:hypothetical protein